MLRIIIVIAVIVVALWRGGALANFGALRLRGATIAIGGLALQLMIFTPFSEAPLVSGATPALYTLSMALLIVWAGLNHHLPGMLLMGGGLLMNTAAITANGGYMPVAPESARIAGRLEGYATSGGPVLNNSISTTDVHLWILTDILPIPAWVPLANVLSIGDVLLTLGMCVLCWRTLRSSAYAASTRPTDAPARP